LGAGEMWQYHIAAEGGFQLTERKNDQQDVNEPSTSTDGRYLYYSEDMYPGGYFQYNKDPNKQIYVIKRYDFKTGKTITVTGGPGGAARPQVSPDGNLLAFVKRVRTKSVLFIHNLNTGEEWPIYDQLSKDQQEAWAIFGVYPGFDWMPNNKDLVFWSQGKIKKVNIDDLSVNDIPFEIENTIKIAETQLVQHPVFQDTFTAKVIRNATTSPDGKTLVFNAVGYLWSKSLPKGKPVRLTKGEAFEFEPKFSPDGKHIVYVTWSDKEMSSIGKISLADGSITTLTTEKGIYRNPSFSNDGKSIVFVKKSGNNDLGHSFSKESGIYLMSASGENIKRIYNQGDFPIFNVDDSHIFIQTGGGMMGGLTKTLKSIDLNGEDERVLVSSKYANRLVPSPDNKWLAFTNLHK